MVSVSWFEIPTSDFDRAVRFYETILESKLVRTEVPGALTPIPMAFFTSGDMKHSGALVHIEEHKPACAGPLVYLNVGADITPVLSRVTDAGGSIIMDTSPMPGSIGFMAIFIDSEGNHMGLMSFS